MRHFFYAALFAIIFASAARADGPPKPQHPKEAPSVDANAPITTTLAKINVLIDAARNTAVAQCQMPQASAIFEEMTKQATKKP